MDDPLAALDASVKKKIFKNLFLNKLKDKTKVLVTHSMDFLHKVDKIVILKEGEVHAVGTYNELKSNEYFLQVLEVHKKN